MASQLHRQRGVILGRLSRIEAFIRDYVSKPGITSELIQARLDVVDQCWVEYDTVQSAIDVEEGINVEEEEEKRAIFEERCINARAALRSIIHKIQGTGQLAAIANSGQPLMPANQFPVLQQQIAVRLPTLELPTFSGDYMDWPAFRDAFEALIDKNLQLSNVQKLLYLKSTLKGEPACMLEVIDTTDANYRVAWDLLVERFENRRIIKQKHLKALFSIKQVPEDSPKELRRLLNECQRNVNALKQFGEPTDEWDTILVYMIASKLDGASRRDWETQTQDDDSPTFDEIVKFINGDLHAGGAFAVAGSLRSRLALAERARKRAQVVGQSGRSRRIPRKTRIKSCEVRLEHRLFGARVRVCERDKNHSCLVASVSGAHRKGRRVFGEENSAKQKNIRRKWRKKAGKQVISVEI
ncbi:uncharacterized protein LOC134291448 [Aedes albopictus]|uniref:Retrotransposon gag domain-containing protein n=1 Tax=Aedes albopictus TaxID=7160 RepID=A0ABM1YGJ5_AEDAL